MTEFEEKVIDFVVEINEGVRKGMAPLHINWNLKRIRLETHNDCWGFIVKQEDDKFGKVGDLLMPANYNTPARHARGNILRGDTRYTKYGPKCLR